MKRSAHRSRVFELLVGLAVLGLGLLGLGSPAMASGWESAGPAHHYDTVVGVGPTVRVSDIEATANRLASQARPDSRGLELDSGSVRSFVAPNRTELLSQLHAGTTAHMRQLAGFADEGVPILVDNSLPVNPQAVAQQLRDAGHNARSVTEIFVTKTDE